MDAMIKLDAGHDHNGNPRRAYLLLNVNDYGDTYPVAAWDEGYTGHDAVPEELRSLARGALRVPTTVTYRNDIMRRHGILDADTVEKAGQDPTLRDVPAEARYGWTAALLEQFVD